jgi:predicted AAA+ superfamily ATPase
MPAYADRIVDFELDELLRDLPAVSIEGCKGVGKTVTARRRSTTSYELDDDRQRELLAANPAALVAASGPVLIDEWQRWPQVWDQVRRAVDAGAPPGRYLLTGSAAPRAPTHSGAGRIVTVRMRPMSLAERGLAAPTVSLRDLLAGGRPEIAGNSGVDLNSYVDEILRSGFPGIRTLSSRALRAQLDGYLDRIVQRDFPEQGRLVRRPASLLGWLRAFAAATATTASYNTILDAATPGESERPAKTTTIAYRDVLAQLWLLDSLPGWTPTGNAITRLTQTAKHHLADPALAARLLNVNPDELLHGTDPLPAFGRSEPLLGGLFESLVALSVRTYAQAAEATVSHLRTRNGDHEVDLIVEGAARRVVAIEVKLSPTVSDRDVRHLHWLKSRIGHDLLDAAVVTTGPYAYRRSDGIAVIPAALLGP